jgi:hypothetical protein
MASSTDEKLAELRSTDEKIAALRAMYLSEVGADFDMWMTECAESPIERLLLARMFAEGWERNSPQQSWTSAFGDIQDAGVGHTWKFLQSDVCPCICVMQAEVTYGRDNFRIDFAFIGMIAERGDGPIRWGRIAVELDGHDFHERTKEQARRDKRRDRVLAANGWLTLRFTGSDVYRDPAAVLDEIVQHCNRLCWPWLEGPK